MSALVYNGTTIHDRGEKLNLTDMWRAAGADDSKRPADWLGQRITCEFIEHLSSTRLIASPAGIIETERGRSGATWAHWQLALAYAQYLSPEFHVWCNEVISAHMEGKLVPAGLTELALGMQRGFTELAQSMERGIERALAPVARSVQLLEAGQSEHRQHLATIDSKFDSIKDDFASFKSDIQASVDSISKRKNLSSKTKKLHLTVLRQLGGRCPACGVVQILNDADIFSGQWDHFFAPHRAKPHETWPICAECNQLRWNSKSWEDDRRPEFDGYQAKLKRLTAPLFLWPATR